MIKYLLFSCLLFISSAYASDIRVGIGRKTITPEIRSFMTGYAGRNKPAEGKIHDLWAKALVLEESPGQRLIIVTTDILGLSHEISEDVAKRLLKKYGINRSQLLMNSSHTHSGPMIWPALSVIADYSPADQQ